jgi:predicted Zn-dependent protease
MPCGVLVRPLILLPLCAALAFALGLAAPARAQDNRLPDMGSSAGTLITPREEQEYGEYTLFQLRHYGYVLEDPLIDSWLSGMGHRLGAASDRPEQPFTFFLMQDRQINAFATLGGYVGMNAGTVLAARNEDEVAGVLAHEISHVTQRHVLRAVERAQKDRIPIMLATLGVIVAAQAGGGSSNGGGSSKDDAIQAAVIGGQALAAQREINFTRSSEAEADRVGIQTLYRSGYNVQGMADFFDRMQKIMRSDAADSAPSYLQTHPVTEVRMSEARERADKIMHDKPAAVRTVSSAGSNPLLPFSFDASASAAAPAGPTRLFDWARERLRVLTASSPDVAMRESTKLVNDAGANATDAQRYGMALAQSRNGFPAAADEVLGTLAKAHPDNLFIAIAYADNAALSKKESLARERYEALLRSHPGDRSVLLSYAAVLNGMESADAGRRAQEILRPILADNADDPLFQKSFGRASELAGDPIRAGESYAEAAYLNGRAEDALNQFSALLKRPDLSYVQRARIEARIAEITPEVMELQKRHIRPEDLPPDNSLRARPRASFGVRAG